MEGGIDTVGVDPAQNASVLEGDQQRDGRWHGCMVAVPTDARGQLQELARVLASRQGPGHRPRVEEGGGEKAGCGELEGEAGGNEAARVGVEAAYDAGRGLGGGHGAG